jgi:predicted acetyltransferase
MRLVWPASSYVEGYTDALERGWSPSTEPNPALVREQLDRLRDDPDGFLASLVDREARGGPIELPDGTLAPRLPGYVKWIWDEGFCGTIGFRWTPGSEALPPTCLGHIGYSVVPWRRRRGYATRALAALLEDARAEGLRYVELTTDPDNRASQRVIEANSGVLHERFIRPQALGGTPALRYRIDIARG